MMGRGSRVHDGSAILDGNVYFRSTPSTVAFFTIGKMAPVAPALIPWRLLSRAVISNKQSPIMPRVGKFRCRGRSPVEQRLLSGCQQPRSNRSHQPQRERLARDRWRCLSGGIGAVEREFPGHHQRAEFDRHGRNRADLPNYGLQ